MKPQSNEVVGSQGYSQGDGKTIKTASESCWFLKEAGAMSQAMRRKMGASHCMPIIFRTPSFHLQLTLDPLVFQEEERDLEGEVHSGSVGP